MYIVLIHIGTAQTSNNSLAASVQATIGGEDLSLSSAGLDKLLAELGHSSSSPFVGSNSGAP